MNLVDRVKNILMTPKTEWPAIAAEEANPMAIMTGYVIPLAVVPALATVIGEGLIGRGAGASLGYGVGMGLAGLISSVLGVYLAAMVMDYLAPNFGSEKNFGRAMQTVAYSYTPAWIGGILGILPVIGWIGSLVAFYGLYLMYLGLPHTMKTPEDKTIVYMVVVIIIQMFIYFVLAAILGAIILGILGVSAMSGMMH
jgi:hypothetical protein